MSVRVLFLGDIVGRTGRDVVAGRLPALRRQYRPDLIIANGENAAGGAGITAAVADDLFDLGIDVLTLGNHAWDKPDVITYIDAEPRLIRPLNYPPGTPGMGSVVVTLPGGSRVGVINACGRVFSTALLDDPFRAVAAEVERLRQQVTVVIVDFHAEATAEKQAMGWYLDGRVAAVMGTHTHVPTADAGILPGGTAYITDVGMIGTWHSVIGMRADAALERFLTQMPVRLQPARGPALLCGVVIEIDDVTGRATAVEPVVEREQPSGAQ